MKILCIFIIFALCSQFLALNEKKQDTQVLLRNFIEKNPRAFETELNNIIECVRQMIKKGILGISLDPLDLKILPLQLNSSFISSDMLLTNFLLQGLAGFEVNKASVDISIIPPSATIDLEVTFKEIMFSTNYNGNMELLNMIRFFGNGAFELDFENLSISLQAKVGLLSLQITDHTFKLKLPSTKKAQVTGLHNNEVLSDIISRQMLKTLNALVRDYEDDVNTVLQNLFKQLVDTIINPMLSELSIEEIIAIITGGGGGGISCETGFIRSINFMNHTLNDVLQHKKYNFDYYENIL